MARHTTDQQEEPGHTEHHRHIIECIYIQQAVVTPCNQRVSLEGQRSSQMRKQKELVYFSEKLPSADLFPGDDIVEIVERSGGVGID